MFAILELSLGVFAFVSCSLYYDLLYLQAPWLYSDIWRASMVHFVVLLVPTTCLGASFPLVAQIQVRRSPRLASHVGSTYAWNTVGNVLGTVITSLVLLPGLGLLGAFHFNFALNLAAGLMILFVAGEVPVFRRLAAGGVAAAAAGLYLAVGTAWLQPMRLGQRRCRRSLGAGEAGCSRPGD